MLVADAVGKLQTTDKAFGTGPEHQLSCARRSAEVADCPRFRCTLCCSEAKPRLHLVPRSYCQSACTHARGKAQIGKLLIVCATIQHKIRRDYSAAPNRDGFGSGLKHAPEVTSMKNRIRATAFRVAESNPMGWASHLPLPSREVDGTNRRIAGLRSLISTTPHNRLRPVYAAFALGLFRNIREYSSFLPRTRCISMNRKNGISTTNPMTPTINFPSNPPPPICGTLAAMDFP